MMTRNYYFKVTLYSFICFLLAKVGNAQVDSNNYISTQSVRESLKGEVENKDFVIFPVDKENPIKWLDSLKPKWISKYYSNKPFRLHAQPGEYFVFQIGLWAIEKDLEDVQIRFSRFENSKGKVIPQNKITCFNNGGIDFTGQAFSKEINVPSGRVQALWMGIDLSKSMKGQFNGQVTIVADGDSQTIDLNLDISGSVLPNQGFNEAKRLSRLAWLNSKVGINDKVTEGYLPIQREGRILRILGRSLQLSDNGLPKEIISFFTASNQSISKKGEPIISHPFRFAIVKKNGENIVLKSGELRFTKESPSVISWKVTNTSRLCNLICEGRMEYDGFVSYHLTVQAKLQLQIKDIKLLIPMNKDKATYMMGLNKPGGLRPKEWNWKWDTTKNQDDVWLGAVNGGLRVKWKANNYVLPLVNVYYGFGRLHLPPSWGNRGKGGVHIYEKKKSLILNAYSGSRLMQKGDEQHYNFELLITPFKTIDKNTMFGARYYHSGKSVTKGFIHEADSLAANIINIHQGNDMYPFINYPYSSVNVEVLRNFISKAHQDQKRVDVYYTTRELTINLPEFWPFVSLNGDIIYPGPGAAAHPLTNRNGPNPWLLKNLKGRKYIPAWVSHFKKGRYKNILDLSVITTPDSRLNNFYVAGLNWMVHHLKIDGIYVDDCSMDRTTIRRVRKILDENRSNANINMHSWNHFNKYAGWAGCLNLYMDLFPYIDQLWIGEGRNYNTPPDYWLVEISGIPFGLPSQMLAGGGNPWRGMVYGMTNRAGWTGTPPDNIWKFWDKYDIKDKVMIGYWEPNNPVSVDNDSIKVTVYKGVNESILAVGNFGSTNQVCSLNINLKELGYDENRCSYFIPEIEKYQKGKQLSSLHRLNIPGGKGYLVVIKKQ